MKQELLKYLVTGVLAVGTDYVSYTLLLHILTHSEAKAISYICGTGVAFFLNRVWTFKSSNKAHQDAVKFTVLYASSLVVNVLLNKTVLFIFPTYISIAFIIATGTTIVMNYVGQKFFVFK